MRETHAISRRSFIKGLTASALGAAALTACGVPASGTTDGTAADGVCYADTIPWNATFDTVMSALAVPVRRPPLRHTTKG